MMSSYLFKTAYIGDRVVCWMLAAVFLVGTCAAAAPAEFAPGLCMVPVKDGTKTWVDEVAAFDARTSAARPTSRYPVLVPLQLPEAILYRHNGGAWKISNDNVLMPFGGGFPNSWLWDHFIVESPSGRILGTGADRKSVFSFDPNSGLFRSVVTAPNGPLGSTRYPFRFINVIARVERLGLTLLGTDNGVFRLHGDVLEQWPGATGRDVGPVVAIEDLPVHGAVMLAGYHNASLRRDDGSVEELIDTTGGLLSRADEVTGAVESRQPGWIVARGVFADWEVEMHPRAEGGFTPGRSRMLTSHANPNDGAASLLTSAGDYFLFRRQGWARRWTLERLEPNGFRPVPGTTVSGDYQENWRRPVLAESIPFRLVLIHGPDEWYSFDGKRLVSVDGTENDVIGGIQFNPTDLPSLGKTILISNRGLFEFQADNRMVPVSTPDLAGGSYGSAEMPSAGVGLIASKDNLYALTRSGTVQPISGATADTYRLPPFVSVLPGRNAMLIQGHSGLHLILQGASCSNAQSTITP